MSQSNLSHFEEDSNSAASQPEQSGLDKLMIRNATWSAILLAIAGLLFFGFGILEATFTDWQDFIVVSAPLALTIISLISIPVLRKKSHATGSWMVFLANLIVPLTSIFLLQDIGGAVLVYTAISSALLIWRAMPHRYRRWSVAIAIVALVLIAIVASIQPVIQLPTPPELITFIIGVTAILLLSFVVQAVRQAWGGNIRGKLVSAFMVITVISLGALAFFTYNAVRSSLENQIGTNFADRAQSDIDVVTRFFLEKAGQIFVLAENDILREAVVERNASYTGSLSMTMFQINYLDEKWIAASENDPFVKSIIVADQEVNPAADDMADMLESFPEHTELILTDRYGATVAATGLLSDYNQGDEEWWQLAWNNGEGALYVSEPEFDESSNITALLIAVPIMDEDAEQPIGVIRSTLNVESLFAVIASEIIGETGHAVLFDRYGEVIFDPRSETENSAGLPQEIRNEFFDEMAHFGLFVDQHGDDMIFGHASLVPEAEGEIHSHTTYYSEVEEQIADTISNLGWSVIFRQSTAEALASVAQVARIALVISIIAVVFAVIASIGLAQLLSNPIIRLTSVAEEVASGNLTARAEATTTDEVGTLAVAFNTMTSRLQETLEGLEQRVAERTQNLELAAEVGRSVSQVRDLDLMLHEACERIQNEFDLYYVQVYLTDPSQTTLYLQAGTGEVGAQLRARSHSLALDAGSINGRAAVEKRSMVISDTAESLIFRPNPLLPETRAEMAVPLIVSEKVVGVLDMQSSKPGSLTADDLPAFEALAGQMAVAIQNANLLSEVESARLDVEKQARRLVREAWKEHMDAIHQPEKLGFMFHQGNVMPLFEEEEDLGPMEENVLTTSITITGEPIGTLSVELGDQNEQTIELINAVAHQVAQQLENLRLLESAERYRTEAEQATRRLTVEGWQQFLETHSSDNLGFLYDTTQVLPVNGDAPTAEEAITLPLKARDETLGKLALFNVNTSDKEALDLAGAVAVRLGAHIESLRQYDQTQLALVQSERLFDVSRRLTEATDLQDIIRTVVETTGIPEIDRAILGSLAYSPEDDLVGMDIVANWSKYADLPAISMGTHYTKDALFVVPWYIDPDPLFFNDIFEDKRINERSMEIAKRENYRTLVSLPLYIGQRRDAILLLEGIKAHTFTKEERRLFTALAPQIATVVVNRRQYEKAQRQAERESLLNTISQQIQSATTVEAVLQIAARELGRALDAPLTIAQLGMKENGK